MGSCVSKIANEQELQNIIQRIDCALSLYYASCGRNDYYNKQGQGKFRQFIRQIGVDHYNIHQTLSEDASAGDCALIQMDCDFPLAILISDGDYIIRDEAIFTVIQYCYKNGEPPSHIWLGQKRREKLIIAMGHHDRKETLHTTDTTDTEITEQLIQNRERQRLFELDCV